MVDFEFEDGYAKLPRDARRRGYHDVDRFVADSAELIIELRDARAAFEAARGKLEEWNAFAAVIQRGQRAGAPLHTLIAEAKQWSAGWWRRVHARTHRPGEPQNSRNSERGLIL